MKPLDKHPARDRGDAKGKQEPRPAGQTGRGAASALAHLIHQERMRVLHRPNEGPKEFMWAQS